jgi:hypothetical protein
MIGAAALAISASIACGDTLPAMGAEDPNEAGVETGSSDRTEASTDDAEADVAKDAGTDAPIEAGPPCTPDLPYDPPQPLDNFDGLGAVSSVRPHHGGAPLAFVARDIGSGGFIDVVESDYPLGGGVNPANMRSGPNDEDHPAPLAGNMKVYYDEPIDAGVLRIFSASRMQAGQKLDNPSLEDIPLGTGGTSVMHPWSVDGKDILYVAIRNSPTSANIWRMEKSGASWAADPQLVGSFEKTHPVVSDDETVMYYATNQGGTRKIWHVTRSSPSASWSNALEMQDVNEAGANDEPTWLSPDKCTLIFISNRSGTLRPYKIVRRHL